MQKRTALKGILKFTIKEFLHVPVQSPPSGSALFELSEVTIVKIIIYAATPPNQPHRYILIGYFNNCNFNKLK
jgi:hypothetical protein